MTPQCLNLRQDPAITPRSQSPNLRHDELIPRSLSWPPPDLPKVHCRHLWSAPRDPKGRADETQITGVLHGLTCTISLPEQPCYKSPSGSGVQQQLSGST